MDTLTAYTPALKFYDAAPFTKLTYKPTGEYTVTIETHENDTMLDGSTYSICIDGLNEKIYVQPIECVIHKNYTEITLRRLPADSERIVRAVRGDHAASEAHPTLVRREPMDMRGQHHPPTNNPCASVNGGHGNNP